MTSPSVPRFSCAPASSARDEPLIGTATHVRTWLLLEHSGSWGQDALLDARLPAGLGTALKQQARAYRAKVVLVRRCGARRDPPRLNVFVADTDPRNPRLEHGTVGDLREVLGVDLTAFRSGGSSGLSPHAGPLFCVCTNGRHDACCAELGRPVASALSLSYPEETWEISHIGGDRFAGNVVVLPEGLYYGRLDPRSAVAMASSHAAGELDLDHLRGRSSSSMATQVAEHHLRRRLGATGIRDVSVQRSTTEGSITEATMIAGGTTYVVRVRTVVDPANATRLTCRAQRDNPVPLHELLSIDQF